MISPPADQMMQVFSQIALERLMQGDAVSLPGLGRLEVQHQPSHVDESEDRRMIVPPRDSIIFIAESE